MSSADVTVRRLQLRAPRAVNATGLRARVEDALRTSSKPAALANRFVLVRRLRLGMPSDASAQSLALQIEHEWRTLESQAEAISTAARDAPVVWAIDEGQARLALLHRWLDERPCDAWFWQRLWPALRPDQPLAQRVLSLLFAPLVDEPLQASAMHQRAWQRQAWQLIDGAGTSPHGRPKDEFRSAQRRGCMLSAAVWAAMGAAQREALRDAVLTGSTGAWPSTCAVDSSGATASNSSSPACSADAPQPGPALEPIDGLTPSGSPWRQAGAGHGNAAAAAVCPQPRPLALGEPLADPAAGAMHTEWAGLWFLLPLLQQQGLERQARPMSLWATVLRLAEQRYRVDDVAMHWLTQLEPGHHAAQLDDDLQAAAAAWWRRARTASLRHARLPLRRLLHRPGAVWFSPHRIDLQLPLGLADIRIRRAGFDIDPGYVPWLDCVIRFHYG